LTGLSSERSGERIPFSGLLERRMTVRVVKTAAWIGPGPRSGIFSSEAIRWKGLESIRICHGRRIRVLHQDSAGRLPIIGFGRRWASGTPGAGEVAKVWSPWWISRRVVPFAADSPETAAGDFDARDRRQVKPESTTSLGKESVRVES
jgi:hypothetical protein